MAKQGRYQSGRFASKSDEPRSVRTMRLTDTAWAKLGEIANSRGITRADLLEEWARQVDVQQGEQLAFFTPPLLHSEFGREVITPDTRKTGSELARRLTALKPDLTSAAISNWVKNGTLEQKTKEHDPDRVAWSREVGTKKYRPIL